MYRNTHRKSGTQKSFAMNSAFRGIVESEGDGFDILIYEAYCPGPEGSGSSGIVGWRRHGHHL